MCWSPAVRASGDGERRLLHPANWKYRPTADLRFSRKLTFNGRLKRHSLDLHKTKGPKVRRKILPWIGQTRSRLAKPRIEPDVPGKKRVLSKGRNFRCINIDSVDVASESLFNASAPVAARLTESRQLQVTASASNQILRDDDQIGLL